MVMVLVTVPSSSSSRVSEGLVIDHVQHYHPAGYAQMIFFRCTSYAPGNQTLTAATNSATVTGSGTAFTQDIMPGDQLYAEQGSDSTPTWIGTVKSIQSNTSLTLQTNACSCK